MEFIYNSTNFTQNDKDTSALMLLGICLGILICGVSILTICILLKCSKLTRQIRLMAIHMTTANLVFGILFLVGRIYELFNGSSCGAIDYATALPFVLFNIFLTASGFDRLFSLLYSIKYTLWTKKQNSSCFIASLYFVGIILHTPHLPTNLHFSCKKDKNIFTYGGLWSFVLSTLLLTTCDVVIYFYIGVIAMKASSSNQLMVKSDYRRFSLATLKTFLLSVITIALLGPFEIRAAANLRYFDNYEFYDSRTAAVLAVFHQIASPILIMVSYKECRFHLTSFVLRICFFKDKRQAIERNYKQYYATFTITSSGC